MNDLTNQSTQKYFVSNKDLEEILDEYEDEYEDEDNTVCASCGTLGECDCGLSSVGSDIYDEV
jgi:hypothetical protein